MEMIKNLVLDADNVIFKKISPAIIDWLVEKSNKPLDKVKSTREKYWALTKVGELTEEENWLGAKHKEGYELGVFGELGILSNKYLGFLDWIKSSYKLYGGCLDFLKKLKTMDVNLYLFSNSSFETIERAYIQFNLNKYFNGVFFSHKMAAAKPNIKAFEILIKETKLSPKNPIFVDDKEKNINAAKELGFNTYLFKNKDDFGKILVRLNGK